MTDSFATLNDLPLSEYAAYRELALAGLSSNVQPAGLPAFFAPRPMSGTLTLGAS